MSFILLSKIVVSDSLIFDQITYLELCKNRTVTFSLFSVVVNVWVD